MKRLLIRIAEFIVAAAIFAGVFTGCSFIGGETLRILSGSENQELAEILEQCAAKTGVKIEMTYKGSVDIMNELKSGAANYDAVWPASSLWISLGDTQHLVKYNESVSTTPVVFGIRKSLAEELGFVGREVSVGDILSAIQDGKLSFCMTSATQSNSGAGAYIGFLYALLGKSDSLTVEDLSDPALRESIAELLSGVDRSSGSSDWLKEMFLAGNFDAMVNYECLIISANEELAAQGREPLYAVYPYDGQSLADSPLGYVDHGSDSKREAFLKVQEYLLSDEVQSLIEKTGRRVSLNGVSEENKDIFDPDWGIDTERIISPITMPSEDVLLKALNLYQTSFRKPSLTVYCLDFSGSMSGDGCTQLKEAMSSILIQEKAAENLLQASEDEINIVIIFAGDVRSVYTVTESTAENLAQLSAQIEAEEPLGGTNIYAAGIEALDLLGEYDLNDYTPAIIMMTDGQSDTFDKEEFMSAYEMFGGDIPIFSIMFGNADSSQLDELAWLTNARVFDGRTNLTEAFRSVKGYN